MLETTLLDRFTRLLDARLTDRRKQFSSELRLIGSRLGRGMSLGSQHGVLAHQAHVLELEKRASITWESFLEAHRALGSVASDGLRASMKTELERRIDQCAAELSASLRPILQGLVRDMPLTLEEPKAHLKAKGEVEVDLYVDTLMTSDKNPDQVAVGSKDLMRQVLKEIKAGKTVFRPESGSHDDLTSFQPVAEALKYANSMGYVRAEFRESHMIGSSGFTLIAIIRGPLTYLGEQLLLSPPTHAHSGHGQLATTQNLFYGPVGAVQTGPNAHAQIVQEICADDREALNNALNLVRDAIQRASGFADREQQELLEITAECKTQINSQTPNRTKLRSMLTVLATTVQSIASAQPAYEALRSALSALNIPLP